MTVRDLVLRLRGVADASAQRLAGTVERMRATATAAAAAMAALGAAMAKVVVDTAHAVDALVKGARAMGLTTQEMQAFSLAAEMAGVEAEQLRVGVATMVRQLGAAQAGSKEAAAALHEVGLSAADAGRPVGETFARMLDGLRTIPAGAQRTAVAMRLMGEQGARMASLIEGGSDAIRGAREQLASMGALISDTDGAGAERLVDAMTLLRARVGALTTAFGLRLIPVAERLVGWLSDRALQFAPIALRLISAAAGVLTRALDLLLTPLGTFVAAIGAGAALGSLLSWARTLPLIGSALAAIGGVSLPAIAAVVALGAAIDDLIVFIQGGDSAIGRLVETLLGAQAAEDLRGIFIGIGDVIAAAGRAIMSALPSYDAIVETLRTIVTWAGRAYDALGSLVGVEGATARLRSGAAGVARGARVALSRGRGSLESAARGLDAYASQTTISAPITVVGVTGEQVGQHIRRELDGMAAGMAAGAR